MKTKRTLQLWILLPLFAQISQPLTTLAQGPAFTYQGRLSDGANTASGDYDLRFAVFDTASAGVQQGNAVTNMAVAVTNGFFTVALDFGNVFSGADRFLEIGVRTNGSGGFTTLSPRQKITATPYAITASDVTGSSVARLNVSNTTVPATGHPIITSGFITSAVIDSGGSGYSTAPSVAVNDATGSGASISATVSNGAVVSLIVNNAGLNYSAGATLTIGVPPSNAYQIFNSTNYFGGVNFLTNGNNVFLGNGAALTGLWRLAGNAGTTAGSQFLGTTDNQPLEIKANGVRAIRLEPTANDSSHSNIVNVIEGAPLNSAAAGVYGATIGGGGAANYQGVGAQPNFVAVDFGTIGGGVFNSIQAGSARSVIAGGYQNRITNSFESTIGGGDANRINGGSLGGGESTIGGGIANTIGVSNLNGGTVVFEGGHVIGGGNGNVIGQDLTYAAIGGGAGNNVQSGGATIAGGNANLIQAGGFAAAIGGGHQNTNNGQYATIPGGELNAALGDYSLAAGRRAKANHDGAFVWADSQNANFSSTASNQFLIRASGGVGIGTTSPTRDLEVQNAGATEIGVKSTDTGGHLWTLQSSGITGSANLDASFQIIDRTAGGARLLIGTNGFVGIGTSSPTNRLHVNGGVSATAFVTTSDRSAKENFSVVSPSEVLAKVAALPITKWNFKEMKDGQHLGPMAQDFYAAFGLGGGETTITTVDADGVALAAIQGLNQKVEAKDAEIRFLKSELEQLKKVVNKLANANE